MRLQPPQVLILIWGLAVLAAVVTLVLADAPTPVVLALITFMPRRLGDEPEHKQQGNLMDGP